MTQAFDNLTRSSPCLYSDVLPCMCLARNRVVVALSTHDPLSLVSGARNQAKNRASVKGKWQKRMTDARVRAIPIERPPELTDKGLPRYAMEVHHQHVVQHHQCMTP
jgi:hypothetical protein